MSTRSKSYPVFGALLRRAREASGMSEAEAAVRLGLTSSHLLNRYERGENHPKPERRRLMLAFIGEQLGDDAAQQAATDLTGLAVPATPPIAAEQLVEVDEILRRLELVVERLERREGTG